MRRRVTITSDEKTIEAILAIAEMIPDTVCRDFPLPFEPDAPHRPPQATPQSLELAEKVLLLNEDGVLWFRSMRDGSGQAIFTPEDHVTGIEFFRRVIAEVIEFGIHRAKLAK